MTTCYLCGDECEGPGNTVPITVGFMTAFKRQAANTEYGATRSTRKSLLHRLTAASSHRGTMETPTQACDECAHILSDSEAGDDRGSSTDTVVAAGSCYACKQSIRSGLAYRFQSSRLAKSSLGFFEYHVDGKEGGAGDRMSRLMASLEELKALQTAPSDEYKLVCKSCIHHFSVSRSERDTAAVTIKAKPWWRIW
jgi:hypothetical protein